MFVDPDQKVEEKRAEFREALKKNEALWQHYADYREKDIEELIDSYALYKARLKVQGNYTRRHHEEVLKEWTGRSWFALCEIQSKKLFDLQCRWRAGEIRDLPGLKWSYDFDELTNILDYETLPDITPDEVEDYIKFLKTPNGEAPIRYGLRGYQDYENIRAYHLDKGRGYMPEYYEHHYTVYGNIGLLSLPDIRQEEEYRLIRLAADFNKAKAEGKKQQQAEPQVPQKKTMQYYSEESKIALAEFLGEKEVAGFIRDLARWVKEKPEFETQWAMDYLSFCYPEDVPMPAAPRWQQAIEKAALQHITLKVQETLPVVYEEYLMKKQLGTPLGDATKRIRSRERSEHPLVRMLELGEKLDRGEEVEE